MRKILVFLLFLSSLISGCSFNVELLTPAPPQVGTTEIAQPIAAPVLIPAAESVSPTVDPAPLTSDPVFFGAYMSAGQNDMSGIFNFPTGTKKIFAHWNYQNMQQGLVIKREWYLDGRLWLTREEPWDFAKYGASGAISDVSIYDFDTGLPSGVYQLQLYINGVQQPIGADTMFGPDNWLNFSVLSPNDATMASSSLDNLWSATVYGMKRIVLRDSQNSEREVFSGREINYLAWFGDSRHFLFVDRDYSGQQAGSPMGIRDDLYITDVATEQVTLLYKADSPFHGYGGPQPSLDGKYISGLIGSGFGDACFVDSRLIFFELAGDFKSVKAIDQKSFSGIPSAVNSVVYPAEEGAWRAGNQYVVTLKGTCGIDPSQMGVYVFDVPNKIAKLESTTSVPMNVGDLGWGVVHGFVTDAVTGKAISGATVACQHSSYTSPSPCTGSVVTSAVGLFLFERVFFHDTDTIKLTVTASGYQPQEYIQSSFTTNDMMADFPLIPMP